MNSEEFKKYGYQVIDWIVNYMDNIRDYPVMAQILPGDIFNSLPENPPDDPESFDSILNDFDKILLKGITHWQHPNFHAYFPANNSYPSILGELLSSALGAQAMIWQTSPAVAELEEKVMIWLRNLIGLPDGFEGVIQDTASTATLVSLLTAREKASSYEINNNGIFNSKILRVYCSTEAHSSIEKAMKIMGLGKKNLVKIAVDNNYAMLADQLENAILNDLRKGYKPLAVVAAFGTTGSTAVDPIAQISKICSKRNIWLHVDAAHAGSALILDEYKPLINGIENADSFVFNPHKWLFTNFDCTAYFVRDKESLIRTFEIYPEYLKTKYDNHVNNYRDWGIQLGRRFRALKLWFVIRSYGVTQLKEKIWTHIDITRKIEKIMINDNHFEILAPVNFNLICFRYKPNNIDDEEQINNFNSELLSNINKTGKIYLSHTKLSGRFTIRLVFAQTNLTLEDAIKAFDIINQTAANLMLKKD